MLTIALFGEAQKGDFRTAYCCHTLSQLLEYLGDPPSAEAQGLPLAIQAILYQRNVVYFRVQEEGFSTEDYVSGLHFLAQKEAFPPITAVCLPGVGDADILELSSDICHIHKSLLITSQKDLYDYLTQTHRP